jgi:ADP-heptose:LPS heptosyltransferase
MKWMRLLDEHWIASPPIVAGGLGAFERLKLRLIRRPEVRFVDTLLPAQSDAATRDLLARYAVQPDRYVLVVPGGGSAQPRMREAPRAIRESAARIAAQGHDVVLVGAPPEGAQEARPETLRVAPPLAMAGLVALIRHARLVVVNGADTLLQAIACGKACVAIPMAPDQVKRLDRLAAAGLQVAAPIDGAEIERLAIELLRDEPARRALAAKAASLNIRDAMETVVNAVTALAQRKHAA